MKEAKQRKNPSKKRKPHKSANELVSAPQSYEHYLTSLNHLMAKGPEIVGWKVTRTLEEAKRLSINAEFQEALATIRERYRISSKRQGKLIDAFAVLNRYADHLNEDDKKKLDSELSALADRFSLQWFDEGEDYGLIVGALCYGLTPDNLTKHWDEIKFSMSKTRTPGARIFLDYGDNVKNTWSAMVTISFLFLRLHETGVYLNDLPEAVREIVLEALKTLGRTGATDETAARAIEKVRGQFFDPKLFIRITSETTLEDVKRTWPQVEMRKSEWLRPEKTKRSPKRTRVWRMYERDVYVWRRVNEDNMTYEKAFDEWLRLHPEDAEKAVELSGVIKAVKRIAFIPKDSE